MAKEFKKIGNNIDLKGIIIHQVIKDAGERRATPKLAKKILKIEEKEKVFISKINKAYFEKSGPIYGTFGNERPDFKNHLREYMTKKNFYDFSTKALGHYKVILSDTIAATGGFVIFAHFLNTEKHFEYMLVMTINNKDGYVVSEDDLTIKDIKNLDLNKVDVACMINLTKWIEIESGDDTESQTYLSFAKGNKDVSFYFMSFIDCENKTTGAESTKRMTNALKDFYEEMEYDRETRLRKRNEIYNYCIGCLEQRKEIQLSAISALVDPENPNAFEEFAATEKYGVSAIISGDKSKLKTMKYVSFSDDTLKIEFDLDLLKKGRIIYNRVKNQLTIKEVPENLKNQIPE
jgi:nucleoid-associated protein